MPVYNGVPYLRETIQSILRQTFSDFEFLIINDGSTDSSVEIINTFIDDRIRLLHNERRLKLSGALNRGIDEAKGEYIARMDADDIALDDRLYKQVAFLDRHTDVGICGSWIRKFGQGRSRVDRFPVSYDQIKAYALFDCPFAHPTVMLRRDFIEKYGLRYNGDYYPTEDYELWGRSITYFPCVNLPEVLLNYRVHESSMTGSDWDDMDRKATRINRTQLSKLEIQCTEEELRFHRNIGRGSSSQANSIDDLGKAQCWLEKMMQANRREKHCSEEAFSEIAALVWYRFCFNSAPLGLGVLRSYLSTSFDLSAKSRMIRAVALYLSIIKKRFICSRTV